MRSRLLGRSGLRVSELCLGTMTFGTEWGFGAEEVTCREIYAAFREAGGTFLDTADVDHDGASERIVGRLVAAERDAVVLGTTFTLPTDRNDPSSGGSHRKSLRRSVEESLRRLATDHVDLLWVHAWDECTAAEETLRALDGSAFWQLGMRNLARGRESPGPPCRDKILKAAVSVFAQTLPCRSLVNGSMPGGHGDSMSCHFQRLRESLVLSFAPRIMPRASRAAPFAARTSLCAAWAAFRTVFPITCSAFALAFSPVLISVPPRSLAECP
ncbi:aldo/keto reductase [Streptomyces olivochromogenes]|uniref:aldo/keto reductase n=1 Tax=Streptomyces olivochromogenes TaxID=1963 RepID=UPI0036D7E4A2